jgi:hypothetical protein
MAMPHTAVAANFNKPSDILVNLSPKFPLNPILPVNNLTKAINLTVGKVICLDLGTNSGLVYNFMTQSYADAIDILQRYPDLFVPW